MKKAIVRKLMQLVHKAKESAVIIILISKLVDSNDIENIRQRLKKISIKM